MLVLVKSSPDTPDGKRGLKFARDMAADLVLLQNGVWFGQKERLEGFCGAAYILGEDLRLRGLRDEEIEKGLLKIDYDGLVDLMAKADKIVGMF